MKVDRQRAGPLVEDRDTDLAGSMRRLLQDSLRFQSISGQEGEFTRFIERWAREAGFETDLWGTDESELKPFLPKIPRHIPLESRPTLVIKLSGAGTGPSLMFNAHSDVVAA